MASTLISISDEIDSLLVFDCNETSHPFSTLYNSKSHQNQQTLFVFIRHFFCGSCKEYICALSHGIKPNELVTSNKRLIIIGCGQPSLIGKYAQDTKCPFPIYADPTQKLYDALGMIRTLSLGEKKPDYIKSSFLMNVTRSALSQLWSGWAMFQGGDIHQVGGEYLIDRQRNIVWSHSMKNTRDHTEISELRNILCLK